MRIFTIAPYDLHFNLHTPSYQGPSGNRTSLHLEPVRYSVGSLENSYSVLGHGVPQKQHIATAAGIHSREKEAGDPRSPDSREKEAGLKIATRPTSVCGFGFGQHQVSYLDKASFSPYHLLSTASTAASGPSTFSRPPLTREINFEVAKSQLRVIYNRTPYSFSHRNQLFLKTLRIYEGMTGATEPTQEQNHFCQTFRKVELEIPAPLTPRYCVPQALAPLAWLQEQFTLLFKKQNKVTPSTAQLFSKPEIPQPVLCATAELHISLSLQQGARKVGIARAQHTVLLTSRYKGYQRGG
ncbi:hypothetical protein Anapl_09059 [Anas platyrhynchos]|uniref:Uncharacterized protein n=1 Tax=Anas platyrhynchos TaxID=8839 RepID=R0KAG2_ANAPL|nr:hypothetical protein Anapl_09059 [Anas platyrhynchos]